MISHIDKYTPMALSDKFSFSYVDYDMEMGIENILDRILDVTYLHKTNYWLALQAICWNLSPYWQARRQVAWNRHTSWISNDVIIDRGIYSETSTKFGNRYM